MPTHGITLKLISYYKLMEIMVVYVVSLAHLITLLIDIKCILKHHMQHLNISACARLIRYVAMLKPLECSLQDISST
jgi:hypothetical protein